MNISGETKQMASSIRITYDITNETWNFKETDIQPLEGTTLEFSFISKNATTQFNDLKFGFSLYHGTELVETDSFPKGDARYESADSYPLSEVRVFLLVEENYTLKVWASNNEIRSESEHNFSSQRLPQPYASWLWVNKTWVPPHSAPEGQHVRWRESNQSWVPVLPDQPVWTDD
jgi:hypothetical protein